MVERHRLLALAGETLVEGVEHLEKGHLLGDPVDLIDLEAARSIRALLTPDLKGHMHVTLPSYVLGLE
jgi:hypothetical protein